MRVCGVEIKGNEAIICLLSQQADTFNVSECRKRSLQLINPTETEAIDQFYTNFKKLMEDYQVSTVVIIEREQKGKFAGSAISFKIETAIQLCGLTVNLIKPQITKAQLKRNPPMVDFSALGLKGFQRSAFEVAYGYLIEKMFTKD